jgi:hypothetical protein
MWKRWLPILLVAEVTCLVIAAAWAVHAHAHSRAATQRIRPAEWPYRTSGSAPVERVVAPPVPFRTDHPPADALNLRPVGPDDATDHSRGNLEVRSPHRLSPELPPDTRTFEPTGATVYYEPLRR